MARRRTLYLPVMIAAALAVLALTLVVAPAAMAQTASVEGRALPTHEGRRLCTTRCTRLGQRCSLRSRRL
jgi:hypothetical protein